jgi:cation diffusion facilitator CzcD-associated flavoprotein CzcO
VAVIGSGATAVQIIPSIAKKVGKLLCYQRQTAWVLPAFQTTFSPFTKWSFAKLPGLQVAYRQFLSNEIMFPAFQYQTLFAKFAK